MFDTLKIGLVTRPTWYRAPTQASCPCESVTMPVTVLVPIVGDGVPSALRKRRCVSDASAATVGSATPSSQLDEPTCAAAKPSDATTADGAPIAGQIKELQNSIAHLLRSNKEMEEIIAESGPDKELRDAIGENIVVIARRKAILADLLKLLAESGQPAAATAAPPLTADGSTADAGVYL